MNIAPQNWSELRKTHTVVRWPESQSWMEFPWFKDEALLLNSNRQLSLYGSSAYLIPKNRIYLRININQVIYKIYREKPVEGDLVLDIKDGSYGYHNGVIGDRIAVTEGGVTEGVLIQYVKKLVLNDESIEYKPDPKNLYYNAFCKN